MLMMLGRRVHTIKKSKEALVVTSKETGLDINAEKTKYRTKSQYKDIYNKSFERVEQFKYLGSTLTN
jgi:hypothetical protein